MEYLWRGIARAASGHDPACAILFEKYRLATDLSPVRGALPTYRKAESREWKILRAKRIARRASGQDFHIWRDCEEI